MYFPSHILLLLADLFGLHAVTCRICPHLFQVRPVPERLERVPRLAVPVRAEPCGRAPSHHPIERRPPPGEGREEEVGRGPRVQEVRGRDAHAHTLHQELKLEIAFK